MVRTQPASKKTFAKSLKTPWKRVMLLWLSRTTSLVIARSFYGLIPKFTVLRVIANEKSDKYESKFKGITLPLYLIVCSCTCALFIDNLYFVWNIRKNPSYLVVFFVFNSTKGNLPFPFIFYIIQAILQTKSSGI